MATTITTHVANMATTLPCLKQFLALFESGMIREFGDTTGTGGSESTRAVRSRALASSQDGQKPRRSHFQLVPDHGTGEAFAAVSADSRSIESAYSNAPIIKKTSEWKITYETK
jgi:hypothetical protein